MNTFALLTLLAACSADNSLRPEGTVSDSGGIEPGTLLVHAYPASDSGYLPQSFTVVPEVASDDSAGQPGYSDVVLELAETVTVSGTLTALVSHPWSAVGAPTSPEPFVGSVQASRPGTVQSTAVEADELGAFRFDVPADSGYELLFLPADATSVPFTALGEQSFFQDRDLTQELGQGAPIFGRITSGGEGVAKAPLVLTRVEPSPSAASQAFYTDSSGWYSARVPGPGTYALTVQQGLSGAGEVLPAVQRKLTVGQDGGTLDVELGSLAAAVLTGTVTDANGDPIVAARVLLTSTSLEGAEGTLQAETTTDDNGSFVARLIPGQFSVAILPPYESASSPTVVSVAAALGSTDIGIVQLGGLTTVRGVVTLPGGDVGAAGVSVTATQVGWSEYAWSTVTDEGGSYEIVLPATEVELLCTPPASSDAATTRVDVPLGGDGSVELASGTALQGVVQSASGVSSYTLVEVHDALTDLVLGTALTNADGVFQMVIDMPLVDDTGPDDTGADSGDTGADTGDTGGADTSDTGPADTGADTGAADTAGDTAR